MTKIDSKFIARMCERYKNLTQYGQDDYDTVASEMAVFKNEYIDPILMKLEVLEIIKRICKNKENYINAEFDDDNFYIDGLTHYKNEKEKEIIKEWLENDK